MDTNKSLYNNIQEMSDYALPLFLMLEIQEEALYGIVDVQVVNEGRSVLLYGATHALNMEAIQDIPQYESHDLSEVTGYTNILLSTKTESDLVKKNIKFFYQLTVDRFEQNGMKLQHPEDLVLASRKHFQTTDLEAQYKEQMQREAKKAAGMLEGNGKPVIIEPKDVGTEGRVMQKDTTPLKTGMAEEPLINLSEALAEMEKDKKPNIII